MAILYEERKSGGCRPIAPPKQCLVWRQCHQTVIVVGYGGTKLGVFIMSDGSNIPGGITAATESKPTLVGLSRMQLVSLQNSFVSSAKGGTDFDEMIYQCGIPAEKHLDLVNGLRQAYEHIQKNPLDLQAQAKAEEFFGDRLLELPKPSRSRSPIASSSDAPPIEAEVPVVTSETKIPDAVVSELGHGTAPSSAPASTIGVASEAGSAATIVGEAERGAGKLAFLRAKPKTTAAVGLAALGAAGAVAFRHHSHVAQLAAIQAETPAKAPNR